MCEKSRFQELEGFMYVTLDGNYHFFDNCPEDLRKKVEEEWPEYKKEILEKQAKGIYDSRDWF